MPEALAFSRQQRRQYLLSLVKELDRVVARDEMALKPRVPFPQEMRELRKLLRLPTDEYLRFDERRFKRNVLMVHSPAHRTHTFWSRYQMWKMATKFGDLQTQIRDAARRGKKFPDLQANDAPSLLRRLDALLDPDNEAKAAFRNARGEVLRTIFGHLQTHFNVGVAFPPFHARFLADRYLPKTGDCIVLDPCAGWGGRLLGTLCVPRTAKVTYYGVDPNKNNQAAYEGLTRRVTIWLKKEMPGDRAARVFAQPFEKWINSKAAARLDGSVSFALTSPPYWSAENYDPTAKSQSANQYQTYEEWRNGFYRPLMQGVFRLLKPGGVFVLNIADVTGAKLERDARKLAAESGFTFKEFFKLAMSRIPGGRGKLPKRYVKVDGEIWKHEPCFSFQKPQASHPPKVEQRKRRTTKLRPLHLATLAEAKQVYRAFSARRDVFPHVRFDAIQRRCRDQQCIYQRGVALTFQRYKTSVRLGSVVVPKGSVSLHQIVSEGKKGAADDVFSRFVEMVERQHPGADIYLTVRKDNILAQGFYRRNGMENVGTIEWMGGKLPGLVYRLPLQNRS